MAEWKWLLLGLTTGWIIHWVLDLLWFRRGTVASEAGVAAVGQHADCRPTDALAPTALQTLESTATTTPSLLGGYDHLELIDGIGPKVAVLLRHRGIQTYGQLAATPVAELKKILQAAGPKFQACDPSHWPEQAELAARGDWEILEQLQGTSSAADAGGRVRV